MRPYDHATEDSWDDPDDVFMPTTRTWVMIFALAIAFTAVAALLFAADALAAGSNNLNDPAVWGDDCVKIDEGLSTNSWTADADYRLVVLKAATVNWEFEDVSAGDVLTTGAVHDVSHRILCVGSPPTYPTVAPTTTEAATTTTAPAETTTTVAPTTTATGGIGTPVTIPASSIVTVAEPEISQPAQPIVGQPTFTG